MASIRSFISLILMFVILSAGCGGSGNNTKTPPPGNSGVKTSTPEPKGPNGESMH